MTGDLVFANGEIVLPDAVIRGTVATRNGTIAAVASGPTAVPGAIDLEGDTLIPGLVELHTDHLETHYMPRPKVRWDPAASLAAHDVQVAGAGITTVLDALRVGFDQDSVVTVADSAALAAALASARAEHRLRADHFIHLRCELAAPDMVEAFDRLAAEPRVRLVSLMDHTPGQRQFTSLEAYRTYYQGKSGLDDAAFAAMLERRIADGGRLVPGNRDFVVAAAKARGFVLASHDDANEAHVAEAVRSGAKVAEFPTTVAAARAAREAGLAVVMGAPNLVRGRSHSGNVATREVAAASLLDVLSSDYVPASLLHAALVLPVAVPAIDLPAAIATVTLRPAEAVGLHDRGAIAEGRRADLVRIRRSGAHPHVAAVWREGRRIA